MSPIELLKEGIVDGSWDKVCQAYRSLTGQDAKRGNSVSPDELDDDVLVSESRNQKPTQRTPRAPFRMACMVCSACNKKVEVHPVIARTTSEELFVCERCAR